MSMRMIKKIFFTGLMAFLPIALTLAIVVWILRNIEGFFGHIVKHIISPQYYFDGLGIILGLIFIFILGLLVNAWIVRRVYDWFEGILKKTPGIKTIYNAIQDMMGFFDHSKQAQQRAVIVNTPIGRMVGFVTREDLSALPEALGTGKDVFVYIPLSYQIGGVMIALPASELIPLDMPVNEAMSMVVTGGVGGQK